METVGEERVRAANCLRQLEEAGVLLEDASKGQDPRKISPSFPGRLSGLLHSLTAISSRDDAERLLATGVAMWNAVIAFEGCEMDRDTTEAMVKVRHIAVDCMYMSMTVLGGISARFNIDDLSLLKFYTVCGQKYATELSDMDMANICFSKGAEFVEAALNDSISDDGNKTSFARAMFDMLLGRAECAWEKGESDQAEQFVNDARKYMDELPGEYEFLASVEYNFGLFTYQSKDTKSALKWLRRSMETRNNKANMVKDPRKQAKTARLAGVCLLALQDYEGSWDMMNTAEQISHDPVGSYLLLKLSVITKKPQALDVLIKAIQDDETSLDICVASISLFGDAQRISDAVVGLEHLFIRFKNNRSAIIDVVGPRYFEALAALGKIEEALKVLDECSSAMMTLRSGRESGEFAPDCERDEDPNKWYSYCSKWSALLLATGSAQADRKDFVSAARVLNRCLSLATKFACDRGHQPESDAGRSISNVVLENEAAVCRLAASCALCGVDDIARDANTPTDDLNCSGAGVTKQCSSRSELLDMCFVHSEKAKALEPDDFAPRLLLFRAYLVAKDYDKAALELRRAGSEISSFDPGALAEAACAARDVGSTASVVAALRCILCMDAAVLSKNLVSSCPQVPRGFFGKILLSCVNILVDEDAKQTQSATPCVDDEVSCKARPYNRKQDLLHILDAGLRGVKTIGMEFAFDEDQSVASDSLTYFVNVCWNMGRTFGTIRDYKSWERSFGLCFQFSMLLPSTADSIQTRRMSKVMCASANVENPEANAEDFARAREHVKEARRFSDILHDLVPSKGDDPIAGLLLILESRCCVGCNDVDALSCVVDLAIAKPETGAGVLEQLASVCYNYKVSRIENKSEVRSRCVDLTSALLSKAGDLRLCSASKDLASLALTMREHLGIELSRGTSAARAYRVFTKASGVALENDTEFPIDERRWLVAVGWDRAQMYEQIGQASEAKRWCENVRQLAEGCVALSTYVPRLDAFLKKLPAL